MKKTENEKVVHCKICTTIKNVNLETKVCDICTKLKRETFLKR